LNEIILIRSRRFRACAGGQHAHAPLALLPPPRPVRLLVLLLLPLQEK
jgi:hypothetical protein